ncbi:MAG TPA: hypothetical protein PKE55_02520 [Kiritimatiellia bacterium]|nr:hypothetical protein [Kiritimatiellia bacterium]
MSRDMEDGAKYLGRVLMGAIAMGVLVVMFHPDYREAAVALWKGKPDTSPIWQSNIAYYPEVGLAITPERRHDPE